MLIEIWYYHSQFSSTLGAYWEGFAMKEIISQIKVEPEDCFFGATHSGAEIDLLINTSTGLNAFEFKFSSHPKIIKYPLSEEVWVVGLEKLLTH